MTGWLSIPGLSDHWFRATQTRASSACGLIELDERGTLWGSLAPPTKCPGHDRCPACYVAWTNGGEE